MCVSVCVYDVCGAGIQQLRAAVLLLSFSVQLEFEPYLMLNFRLVLLVIVVVVGGGCVADVTVTVISLLWLCFVYLGVFFLSSLPPFSFFLFSLARVPLYPRIFPFVLDDVTFHKTESERVATKEMPKSLHKFASVRQLVKSRG